MKKLTLLAAALLLCGQGLIYAQSESIFNGKDLTGWIPKFTGHPSGENYKNNFTSQIIHFQFSLVSDLTC